MTESPSTQQRGTPAPRWKRALGMLNPAHVHSAFSATLFLMVFGFLSRIMGLVRVKYIAWLYGRGMEADALTAAFVLPDMISYFLIGGAASITFVTLLTRYRDSGREAEGERSFSVILTTMYLVLGTAILLAEIAAPLYVRHMFPYFDSQKAALCIQLTRILLPAQLFFFAGGIFGAVLWVRKQFNAQAIAPLIYTLGTIVGGILLSRYVGVSSLAIGTVVGAFCGPFLLNAIYARRAGMRYKVILDWKDEGLREWVKLSLPLMAGVSLVTADNWIITHYASDTGGAIALTNYAKQLFTAPMAVLAQAAGVASMPFFASLWTKGRHYEFATQVADSVSRVSSLGLLASSAMIALATPLVDLFLTGGRFSSADAHVCAMYFCIFAITMFLWSAQAIYSRAFYAAGNTLTPMIAGTAITLVSLPIYASLHHLYGSTGLVIASNIGIAMQTVVIAVLLHKQRMVSLASLDYRELGRCTLAGIASGAACFYLLGKIGILCTHLWGAGGKTHVRISDLLQLLIGSIVWTALTALILQLVGSALPRAMWKRIRG